MATIQERIDVLQKHGMSRDAIAAVFGITSAEVAAVDADPSSPVTVESGSESNADAPIPAWLEGTPDDTPLEHTWAAGDLAVSESLYGEVLMHFEEWTALASGTVLLAAPPWDGSTDSASKVRYSIFEGAIEAVPDREGIRTEPPASAVSYWEHTTGSPHLHDDEFDVVEGTTYTLAAVNDEGLTAVGRVVSLREWAMSIAPYGGAPQLFSWRQPTGWLSRAEGYDVTASGREAHGEGYNVLASGTWAHAEGGETVSSGQGSHAEGCGTQATDLGAHAEGYDTLASGYASHAEGGDTIASGLEAHAEGANTVASGQLAHAEGYNTLASGFASHAEGIFSDARTAGSHARGGLSFSGAPGESQYVSVERQCVTTSAVPTPVSNNIGGASEIQCAPNRVVALRGMVAARSTDGLLGAAWLFKAAARIDGDGVVTLLGFGTVDRLGADEGADAWDILIEADAGAVLRVMVTGAADTEIHWSCTAETKEVG